MLRSLLALTEQEPAYAPVAVQVDPDENDFVDVERARRYLSKAVCLLAATKLCRSTGARPAISSSSWTSSGDDAGCRRGPPYDQEC